jgi:flavin reductase (DIM6/NTAB) family NADH-FMN oxidoreductase RutF
MNERSSAEANDSTLSQALGQIPSGLFILTVRRGERSTGMLASWVQQAGFDPPMITVALQRDRFATAWIEETGRFTLSQLAVGSKGIIRHFGRGFGPDDSAFEGLDLRENARGGPVLADALAYLDAEVADRLSGGDHQIVLARVIQGGVLDPEAKPLVHVRRNGFHY